MVAQRHSLGKSARESRETPALATEAAPGMPTTFGVQRRLQVITFWEAMVSNWLVHGLQSQIANESTTQLSRGLCTLLSSPLLPETFRRISSCSIVLSHSLPPKPTLGLCCLNLLASPPPSTFTSHTSPGYSLTLQLGWEQHHRAAEEQTSLVLHIVISVPWVWEDDSENYRRPSYMWTWIFGTYTKT